MVRLLLVEDHAAFRDALAYLLGLEPWLEVVARCGSLAECRALGDLLGDVDVAVLDLVLPDGNGADLIRDLRAANPSAKVLVLTASIEGDVAGRAEALGADGVLHKAASPSEVASEVARLADAGGWRG